MIELLKKPIEPAIKRGVSMVDYQAAQALSSSTIRLYSEDYDGCPAKARHAIENPDTKEPTDAMEFGTTLHALILEPDYFDDHFVEMDDEVMGGLFQQVREAELKATPYLQHKTLADYQTAGCRGLWSTGKAKALAGDEKGPSLSLEKQAEIYAEVRQEALDKSTYAQFETYETFVKCGGRVSGASKPFKRFWAECLAADKQPVKPGDLGKLKGIQNSLQENPEIMGRFTSGEFEAELSLFATLPITIDGVDYFLPVKARLDHYANQEILDLKSARTANRMRFPGAARSAGYDLQAAWYWRVAKMCGLSMKQFGFVAVEKEPPYISTIHEMPHDWIEFADHENLKIVRELARSILNNDWPGVPSGEMLPPTKIEEAVTEYVMHSTSRLTRS